jgi:UDP:flavonoid glycosyltransferase YjiC (YdhE family)
MLPLVASAVHAGHEVTFATGSEGIHLVARPGVRAVELGHSWADSSKWYGNLLDETKPALKTPDDALLHYILNVFIDYLAHGMAPGLIRFVAEQAPDVVISETSELAGRVAATLAGVPHIVHGFGPQQSGKIVTPVTAALVPMQARYGIPADVTRTWNDELYLDIWPEAIDDDSPKMFENARPLRPAAVSSPLPPDPVLDGLPFDNTVYVTIGTMFNATAAGENALDKLISVFADEQLNAVVTVGRDGDVDRFDRGLDNVIVRDFIPQDAVLPYVDAVLSHGGSGTALGALAHGIPHVMMPLATDQHRIAARIARAGAGLVVSHESSVDEVRSAVRRAISEPGFAEGANYVSLILRAIPDSNAVLCDIAMRLKKA